jgi:hypothetical protein
MVKVNRLYEEEGVISGIGRCRTRLTVLNG